jgi:hypothetical protein
MVDLIKEFEAKTPRYSTRYRDLIERFARKNARDFRESGEDVFEMGKYFSNFYEFYMYAALLGMNMNYELPFEKDEQAQKFLEIREWKHEELRQYMLMGLLAKSNFDMNAVEDMEDEEVKAEIRGLVKKLEGYANGGLDIINSKLADEPHFFDSDNCFIRLLKA